MYHTFYINNGKPRQDTINFKSKLSKTLSKFLEKPNLNIVNTDYGIFNQKDIITRKYRINLSLSPKIKVSPDKKGLRYTIGDSSKISVLDTYLNPKRPKDKVVKRFGSFQGNIEQMKKDWENQERKRLKTMAKELKKDLKEIQKRKLEREITLQLSQDLQTNDDFTDIDLEEEFEPEILENTEAEIKAKDDEEWDAYKKSITRRASQIQLNQGRRVSLLGPEFFPVEKTEESKVINKNREENEFGDDVMLDISGLEAKSRDSSQSSKQSNLRAQKTTYSKDTPTKIVSNQLMGKIVSPSSRKTVEFESKIKKPSKNQNSFSNMGKLPNSPTNESGINPPQVPKFQRKTIIPPGETLGPIRQLEEEKVRQTSQPKAYQKIIRKNDIKPLAVDYYDPLKNEKLTNLNYNVPYQKKSKLISQSTIKVNSENNDHNTTQFSNIFQKPVFESNTTITKKRPSNKKSIFLNTLGTTTKETIQSNINLSGMFNISKFGNSLYSKKDTNHKFSLKTIFEDYKSNNKKVKATSPPKGNKSCVQYKTEASISALKNIFNRDKGDYTKAKKYDKDLGMYFEDNKEEDKCFAGNDRISRSYEGNIRSMSNDFAGMLRSFQDKR